jgi:hypothetical protein
MRDHELELIAALVEGRLEDEAEARALIASSTEHQEEYLAQKTAYDSLRSLPPAAMSDTERAALHRDVWTELRSPVGAAAPATPWYYRWVPVAAGMFVIVGLVAVINDDGSDTVTREFAAVTTAAAESDGGTVTGADSGQGGQPGDAGSEGTVAPTGQPPATDAPVSESPPSTLESLDQPEQAYYEAEAEKVREGEVEGVELEEQATEPTRADLEACVEEAGLEDYQVVAARTVTVPPATTDETVDPAAQPTSYVAAVPSGVTLADAPVAFVDFINCVLIHFDD